MLAQKTLETLKTINELFKTSNIGWRLVGGSNLHLQNVPVEPKDIDILISKKDVERAQKVLEPYTVVPMTFRDGEQHRSYLGKYTINNTEVEIMSNLEVFKDNTWSINTVIENPPVLINVGSFDIPCISLRDEYDGYTLMGRHAKAELIKNTMQTILSEVKVRQVTLADIGIAQKLRNIGWQDNYVNIESGVTRELLETKLATVPVPQSDIDYYTNMLKKPENKDKNLVAEYNGKIIGVIMYDTLESGNGDIGIFIDRAYRGMGIGSLLLNEQIKKTSSPLEVTIFAKNRSRNLYKRFGFIKVGEEDKHFFDKEVFLPIQRLVLSRLVL